MLKHHLSRGHISSRLLSRSYHLPSDIYKSISPLNPSASGPKSLLEFQHISNAEERAWLESEYQKLNTTPMPIAQKLNTLRMIQMSETFEHFVHKKFGTYKRYSGEGTESLVPSLHSVFNSYYPFGESIILTIAHRGKLAVLSSLMNYPLRNLFYKIKGNSLMPEEVNRGTYYYLDDIATHIAVTAEKPEMKGLKVSMLHNPSHLEIGGGVGMGKTRAKIDRGAKAMHVWVHGDAALSGQGVVYELTQMAHLEKFGVGGTLHVVANNQLGFTANESMGRSTAYCTDVFKIIEAPVIHVNAMAVEDVVKVSSLAVNYRNKFSNDVVIDLVGYRRYGHNEVDDPTFTNPLMYKTIRQLSGAASSYASQLISEGVTTQEYIDKLKLQLETHLNKELSLSSIENLDKTGEGQLKIDSFKGQWSGFTPIHNTKPLISGYDPDKLREICRVSTSVPPSFKIHPILMKNLQARNEAVNSDKVDWATAEILAFGSLAKDGFNVRLCGEDSIRGTFSQRQIGVYCQETEKYALPLAKLGNVSVVNSILSELAVVGFEYGYALDHPKNLVLWEAQFGDFANMAQPIIDTYVASGEAKWMRQSGLVMLLPHGQEAQGPDHSSAQIERYLGLVNNPLSTQVNIEVYNMVHPSNYFHLLRRSMLRDFRRPIIVATPKSALRNKLAVSSLSEFNESSSFNPVIFKNSGNGSKKLVICSGKVSLDLLTQFKDISLAVIEQLAPLPLDEIVSIVNKTQKEVVWVQEEPKNFGVYNWIRPYLEEKFGKVQVVARPEISANAVGNSIDYKDHQDKFYQEISRVI